SSLILDKIQVWKVGTSGWSYPPSSGPGAWTGVFYPFKKTDELGFYSNYFNAVEVNSTFYRPCSPKTAESWVKRTPEDFEFTVKPDIGKHPSLESRNERMELSAKQRARRLDRSVLSIQKNGRVGFLFKLLQRGRSQFDVLPSVQSQNGRKLGQTNARGFRIHRQG